jgi:hypothetical protein
MRALLEELTNAQVEDPTFKAIVFSQWTEMLTIVERIFSDLGTHGYLDVHFGDGACVRCGAGISMLRFDGSMSKAAR